MARRTGSITIFAAILAALLALWAPAALAHHKDDHPQGGGKAQAAGEPDGDADSDSGTAYTEDNDTNDGGTPNNVSDDGDNAHPSGRDKSVENGNSGNQGNSESNPDDSKGPMRYEGALGDDKPNGPGGTDLADQDGNNGCGNDDDFDDDNNGWCGKPKDTESDVDAVDVDVEEDVTVDHGTKGKVEKAEDDATPSEVLGIRLNAAAQPAAVAPAVAAKAAVAPAVAAQGGVLPFTGSSDLLPLVAVALMLIAAGALGLRSGFSSK